MPQREQYLAVCEAAARAGGKVLQDWWHRISAREKAPRDLVTEADVASQEAVQRIVLDAFPTHGFVGEEDASRGPATDSEYRWIVDPLDGTANYVHGLRPFCVSVALARGSEVLAGVVFDPIHDECFAAEAGRGARLNGEPLSVSNCGRLNDAMVASSFAANIGRDSEEIRQFVEVVVECRSLRRLGSAALNLCYLAAGQLDAYWTTSAKSWDVAAGVLIVREAGGIITAVDGTPLILDRPRLAAAATPALHSEFVQVLKRGLWDSMPEGFESLTS